MKLVILDDSHKNREENPLANAARWSEAFCDGVFPLDGNELVETPNITAVDFTRELIEPLLKNEKGDTESALVTDLNMHGRQMFGLEVLRTLYDDGKPPSITFVWSANITQEIRAVLEELDPLIEMRHRMNTTYDKILRLLLNRLPQ